MNETNILNNLYDLIDIIKDKQTLQSKVEMLKLEKALYKAYFYGKSDLVDKLKKQIKENEYNITGEFDGFLYSSERQNAKFKTLESMREENIISRDEYNFCIL